MENLDKGSTIRTLKIKGYLIQARTVDFVFNVINWLHPNEIRLEKCGIDKTTAMRLLDIFKKSQYIKKVSLSWNEITSISLNGMRLTYLNLSHNNIEHIDYTDSQIDYLDITGHSICDSEFNKFLLDLSKDNELKSCKMIGNKAADPEALIIGVVKLIKESKLLVDLELNLDLLSIFLTTVLSNIT